MNDHDSDPMVPTLPPTEQGKDPDGSDRIRLARTQMEQGRYVQALVTLDEELGRDWDAIAALHLKALVLERTDALDDALRCCENALDLNPNHLQSLMTKGSIHARRGERMNALECFHRLARLRPEWAAGQHLLASVGGKGFAAPLRGEVVDLFDRYAERFDRHLVQDLGYRGHIELPQAIKAAAGVQTAPWWIVELGCGTGLCGTALKPLAHWLIGTDISERILERARSRQVYDVLYVADLVYALCLAGTSTVDLIASADVFSYLGDLKPVFEEGSRVLKPGGRLAFTVEAATRGRQIEVRSSRRVAFSQQYLRELALTYRFRIEILETLVLRREAERDVVEWVAVMQRQDEASR